MQKENIHSVSPEERILIERFMGDMFYFPADWNGVMLVIERIRDCKCVVSVRYNRHVNTTTTEIHGFMKNWHQDLVFQGESIASPYQAILAFIKWYNKYNSQ